MAESSDLLLVNGRVLTLDDTHPITSAIAVRGGRIRAVGCAEDVRPLIGPHTPTLDCQGGVVVPAFHDAHIHLFAWARFQSGIDFQELRSIEALQGELRSRAAATPRGEWVRGNGYDEALLSQHPDRHDLDDAAPDHPVRVQHRSLHLDVLNSRALEATGLAISSDRRVERDPATGEATGRVFNGGDLLRADLNRPSYETFAADMRRATEQLLAWGVTSVQDASFTNAEEEWELLFRLAADGALRVRTFMLVGSAHWRGVSKWRPESDLVRRGPVKLMLDERTTDPDLFGRELYAIREAGQAVAVHAVSEAEVAWALDALSSAPPGPARSPNRLEHAAVVPDALVPDLAAVGAMVVGQPALVHERGDVYRMDYRPEQHAWLHRARSFLAAGIPYAVGSDAPVTEPNPAVGLSAALDRATRSGAALAPSEALPLVDSLRAFTLGPAQAVGVGRTLGRIRPGMIADIAVLDPDALRQDASQRPLVRTTIMGGRVVAGG